MFAFFNNLCNAATAAKNAAQDATQEAMQAAAGQGLNDPIIIFSEIIASPNPPRA
ncbi:hypothetical protein BG000_010960 [Podila horticola]|nr:hypothetical protein BG000_010960 [Podila horticola]